MTRSLILMAFLSSAVLVGCSDDDDKPKNDASIDMSTDTGSTPDKGTTPDTKPVADTTPTDDVTTVSDTTVVGDKSSTDDTGTAAKVLVINEVAAKGDPEDWVEIYNPGSAPIDIATYYLTDEYNPTGDDASVPNLKKASFANAPEGTTIQPGEYKVYLLNNVAWADFKLSKDEEVAIIAPDGTTIIDSVDWADGDSPDGGSYARIPDVTGDFQAVTAHTKGAKNVLPADAGTPDAGTMEMGVDASATDTGADS